MKHLLNNLNTKLLRSYHNVLAVITLIAVSALVILTACTTDSTPVSDTQEPSSVTVPSGETADTSEQVGEVLRISKEELLLDIEDGENVPIVDTRYKSEYNQGHIKGAVSVPYSEIVMGNWQPLPDQEVVLYCS